MPRDEWRKANDRARYGPVAPSPEEPPLAPDVVATCPRCRGSMVVRTNRETGAPFLGCAAFPSCRGIRQMAEANQRTLARHERPERKHRGQPEKGKTIQLGVCTIRGAGKKSVEVTLPSGEAKRIPRNVIVDGGRAFEAGKPAMLRVALWFATRERIIPPELPESARTRS
ncbi:topoisomerase DNA-binding C4 zinc finger domain-containing protein [bacterium]|nr:topoisomerase DNA-binding C4 zinc finger domain-containing protein [Rhodospirillales bacterium]MBN9522254.1 topoisomerase DNA-binding C4 zinc finger domain-containing protein [bacterium]